MARAIEIKILGDESDLLRSYRRAGAASRQFERNVNRSARGVVAASLSFKGLGRSIGFASAAFLGGAGVTYALKSTVSAAMEAERVNSQLANALEKQGISLADNRRAIQQRTDALSQMSGVDDELLTGTFTQFVRQTNDVTKALNLNAIAVNVARGRNISLQAAAGLVTKANLGMAGSLRRVGIEARKGASAAELLDLLQRKYAGSAEAYGQTAAGAQERFKVALENTQEIIGTALLPPLTRLLNRSADWLNDQENQKRLQDFVNQSVERGTAAVEALASAWGDLKNARDWLQDADPFGGKSILELAQFGKSELPGFVAELLEIEAASRRIAEGFNDVEAARVGAFGPAAVQSIEDFRLATAAGVNTGEPSLNLPRPAGRFKTGRPLSAAEQLAIGLAGDPDNVGLLKQQRARSQAAYAFAMRMIRERHGNTAKFADAAEREAGRIAAINARLAGIAEGIARDAQEKRDRAKDAREKRDAAFKEMIEEAVGDFDLGGPALKIGEIRRKIAENDRKAEQAKQFRALGLTSAGENLAPTRKALRAELAKVQAGLRGTILDTDPNRNILRKIRKVLSGEFQGLTRETRLRVKEMLDALNPKGDAGNPLAGFHRTSTRKLTEGLGLSRAERVALRQRLAGAHLAAIGQTAAVRGGTAVVTSTGTVINISSLNVAGVKDVDGLIREMKRRAGHTAASPRGRHGGHKLALD